MKSDQKAAKEILARQTDQGGTLLGDVAAAYLELREAGRAYFEHKDAEGMVEELFETPLRKLLV